MKIIIGIFSIALGINSVVFILSLGEGVSYIQAVTGVMNIIAKMSLLFFGAVAMTFGLSKIFER